MGNVNTAGPNEVLVISGSGGNKYIRGGWGWSWFLLSKAQRISVEVMTLYPVVEHTLTSDGVPVTVKGICQMRVFLEPYLLQAACEQLLGKSPEEIKSVVIETIHGPICVVIGSFTLEAIYKDRRAFSQSVREVLAVDLGRMGLEVLSCNMKDIIEDVYHLSEMTSITKRTI